MDTESDSLFIDSNRTAASAALPAVRSLDCKQYHDLLLRLCQLLLFCEEASTGVCCEEMEGRLSPLLSCATCYWPSGRTNTPKPVKSELMQLPRRLDEVSRYGRCQSWRYRSEARGRGGSSSYANVVLTRS